MSRLDYCADPNNGTEDERLIFDVWHEWGFCSCGRPEDVLAMVRDRLREISNREKYEPDWTPQGLLLAYVLDAADLTEHGGGVATAWPTERGTALLAALDRAGDLDGVSDRWGEIGLVPKEAA